MGRQATALMLIELDYLVRDRDRHGNVRIYVRWRGRKIRLRELEGSAAFATAYSAALERLQIPAPSKLLGALTPHPEGSLGWMGAKFFASKGGLLSVVPKSQQARRSCLEACFRDPLNDEDPEPMGNCPLKHFSAQKVRRLIELKADQPGAAANRRKHLSAMCAWAVEHNYLPSNVARDVKPVKGRKGGFYTWTIEDVHQFMARWPIGTRPMLALALILFTGARRQDMVDFGKQHVRAEWIRYVPKKTLHKRRDVSQKPWLPVLADIVARSPCGSLTFLETAYGKPFTANGFGGWFRDRCDDAGLPQCTAHGLKKIAATIAAENGATVHQLMAMFDWTTISQAKVYTDAADRRRLAGEAMFLISLDRKANEDCPTSLSHLGKQSNNQ